MTNIIQTDRPTYPIAYRANWHVRACESKNLSHINSATVPKIFWSSSVTRPQSKQPTTQHFKWRASIKDPKKVCWQLKRSTSPWAPFIAPCCFISRHFCLIIMTDFTHAIVEALLKMDLGLATHRKSFEPRETDEARGDYSRSSNPIVSAMNALCGKKKETDYDSADAVDPCLLIAGRSMPIRQTDCPRLASVWFLFSFGDKTLRTCALDRRADNRQC